MIKSNINSEIKNKFNVINNSVVIKADHFKEQLNFRTKDESDSEKSSNSKKDNFINNLKNESNLEPNKLNFKIFGNDNSDKIESTEKSSDYISNNIEKASKTIKEINNQSLSENTDVKGTSINTDYIYVISDAISAVENKNMFSSSQMNNINNILDKITTGDPLNENELTNLKSFSDFIINNSEKLGLEKADFQKLSNLVSGVINAQKNVNEKKSEFLQEANVLSGKMDNLIKLVSDPSVKADGNLLTMLNSVQSKYKNILASGNPLAIKVFSSYIDKIMQNMQDIKSGKQKDPLSFDKLQTQYTKFMDNFFNYLSKGNLPPDSFLKEFLGNSSKDILEIISSKSANLKTLKNGETKTETTSIKQLGEEMKTLMTLSAEEKNAFSSVSIESIVKIMKNEKVASSVNDIRSSVDNLSKKLTALANAFKELDKKNEELKSYILSSDFKKIIDKVNNTSGFINKVINDQINNLISRIEELEANLNLDFDNSGANISELFRKFKEIIIQLDIELKHFQQKNAENKAIDEKNIKSVKEKKDREISFNIKEEGLKRSLESAKSKFSKVI